MTVNLIITDLSWNPTPLMVGIHSQAIVTIINQGDETFIASSGPSTYIRLYISGVQLSDVHFGGTTFEVNDPVVLAGASYTPSSPGIHSSETQFFYDGTPSNIFSTNLTVLGLPDLVIDRVDIYPLFPAVGDVVDISAIVRNVGTLASPETPHNIQFFIDDTLIGTSSYTNSIPIDGSTIINADHVWRPTTEGLFTLLATINGNNAILESNATNNSLAKLIGILPRK